MQTKEKMFRCIGISFVPADHDHPPINSNETIVLRAEAAYRLAAQGLLQVIGEQPKGATNEN